MRWVTRRLDYRPQHLSFISKTIRLLTLLSSSCIIYPLLYVPWMIIRCGCKIYWSYRRTISALIAYFRSDIPLGLRFAQAILRAFARYVISGLRRTIKEGFFAFVNFFYVRPFHFLVGILARFQVFCSWCWRFYTTLILLKVIDIVTSIFSFVRPLPGRLSNLILLKTVDVAVNMWILIAPKIFVRISQLKSLIYYDTLKKGFVAMVKQTMVMIGFAPGAYFSHTTKFLRDRFIKPSPQNRWHKLINRILYGRSGYVASVYKRKIVS